MHLTLTTLAKHSKARAIRVKSRAYPIAITSKQNANYSKELKGNACTGYQRTRAANDVRKIVQQLQNRNENAPLEFKVRHESPTKFRDPKPQNRDDLNRRGRESR